MIKKINTDNDKTKLEKFKDKETRIKLKQNNLNELVTRFRLSKFN